MDGIEVVSDHGEGRATVVIDNAGGSSSALASLPSGGRTVCLSIHDLSSATEELRLTELTAVFAARGLRHVTLIGVGRCGALAQVMTLRDPKLVRKLILVDATTRASPGRLARIADRVERFLPLGLPLRLSAVGFDTKPFLQRIRCPTMVISTSRASAFERAESAILAAGIPTSWCSSIATEQLGYELAALVEKFDEIPAKCPQRKGGEGGSSRDS